MQKKNWRLKKGFGIISAVVLLAVTLLVLAIFLGKLKTSTLGTVERSMCKESVQTAAGAKITWQGSVLIGDRMPISCSTDYITKKYKEEDAEKVMEELADAMYICWDNFHRGELEVFDTTDNNFCVVCARLDFPQFKKKEADRKIDGFMDYLMEKQVPFKGMSYFTFFQGEDASSTVAKGDYFKPNVKSPDLDKIDDPDKIEEVIQEALKNADTQYLESSEDIANLDGIHDYDYMMSPDLNKGPIAIVYLSTKNALKGKAETGAIGTKVGAAAGGTAAAVLIAASFIPGVNIAVWAAVGGGALLFGGSTIVGGLIGYDLGADHTSDHINSLGLVPAKNLADLRCTWLEGEHGLDVIDRDNLPKFKVE